MEPSTPPPHQATLTAGAQGGSCPDHVGIPGLPPKCPYEELATPTPPNSVCQALTLSQALCWTHRWVMAGPVQDPTGC